MDRVHFALFPGECHALVIIFDELTSVLQEKEIENIFRVIHLLKERGIGDKHQN
ncbi:MAG: hypothetical protein NTX88_03790 [Candidatus Atribacteria bacterium]|nr:hypothetical protein [Candidatus Atribacteria bacterium]